MHFAGLKAVGESCEKPLLYYRNNIGGTMTLLEVCNAMILIHLWDRKAWTNSVDLEKAAQCQENIPYPNVLKYWDT